MPEISPSKYLVQASWADVPHITAEAQAELLADTPRHLREARSKGVPSLGSGAIYPYADDEVCCDAFQIPAWWKRWYALDVGWNRTAAAWFTHDPNADIIFIYTEHYVAEAKPAVHATSIKARGDWMKGVTDPASRGRSQIDGEQLYNQYIAMGLHLAMADNAVDAGIWGCEQRFSTGRLKIVKSGCPNLMAERRLYRRDENGKIVKTYDHLMDCMRYGVAAGPSFGTTAPASGLASIGGPRMGDRDAGY